MKNRLGSLARTFLAGSLLLAGAWARGDEPVRILEQTPTSLTLELELPKSATDRLKAVPGKAVPVRVSGWAHTTALGRPDLPTTGLLVPVPPEGRMRWEILEDRQWAIPGLQPTLVAPEDRPDLDAPRPAATSAPAQPGVFPSGAVELSDRIKVGGETMARVLFHPFRYDAARGELLVSGTLRVRILFEEPLPRPAAPGRFRPVVQAPARASGPAKATAADPANVGLPAALTAVGSSSDRDPAPFDPIQGRLRMEVTRTGLYRIAYEDLPLAAMGRPPLAPNHLQLTCQGRDVPLRVTCASGSYLATGDYLEFYGQALNSIHSGTNVYSLSWLGRPRQHFDIRQAAPGSATPTVTSFMDILKVEQNKAFWSITPGAPQEDFWFWERLTAPIAQAYTFELPAVDAVDGHLTVRMLGNTTYGLDPDHHAKALLNDQDLGVLADLHWDGLAAATLDTPVKAGILAKGTNTLTVFLPGDTGAPVDQIWMNNFEVRWSHALKAVGDRLTFPVQGSGDTVVRVGGFSSPALRLLDVTDPASPKRLEGFSVASGSDGYELTFKETFDGERIYFAGTEASSLKPDTLQTWPGSGIRRSRLYGADYLLITPRTFLAAAEPLLQWRRSQGLRAVGVAVEDIFNEFSEGIVDPQAIKDFLTHAYRNWQAPAPRFVLLLGDASFDPHNYQGFGKKNLVPVHFAITMPDQLGLTPDDNWYVSADDEVNELPVMMLGRLPAATPGAVTAQIQKIMQYEQSSTPAASNALFVADNQSPEFSADCDELASYLPATMTARKIYLDNYVAADIPAKVNTDILDALNQGTSFVSYFGHGNTGFWTRNILQTTDVARITSTAQPLVMSFDCLTGYFAAPGYYSLGETLTSVPGKGAIAVFGSSGLGFTWEHEILARAVFQSLFGSQERTLGTIATQSKLDAFASGVTADTVRIFNLLGDPAMKLKAHP